MAVVESFQSGHVRRGVCSNIIELRDCLVCSGWCGEKKGIDWRRGTIQEEKMKHLPRITLLLWGLMIAGYVFLPEVVLRDAVQYPFVVLLSIFLPISLWLSVQDGKKLGVVILAGIFLANVALLVFALERNYTSWKTHERSAGKGIFPPIAGLLAGKKDAVRSQYAARYI